ncbi:MAG: hypothetical protein RLZZ175_2166 [Bacteroidota bacterium]|jgi:hypothetical protein
MITLDELVIQNIEGKNVFIKRISDLTSSSPQIDLLNIWFCHESIAVKNIRDMNFDLAKNHFYNCGLIDVLRCEKFNDIFLEYALVNTCCAILSDNERLIERFASLSYKPWGKMKGMEENVILGKMPIWSNTIQHFMINNKQGIERNLNILETKTIPKLKKNEQLLLHDFEFFKALYNKDKNKVEEILDILTSSKIHKKRTFNEILGQYVSFPALGYAKLAWRHGIEVKLSSSLIPKELLPIKPLTEYKSAYDFLPTL